MLVDLQDAGLGGIAADGDGVRIGATATLADVARSELVAPYAAVATAAGLAASPLLRNQGTVGGNLCQHTRCWYYRGEEWTCWLGGGDTCYAQIGDHRKHNLEEGDCISAHPSDLAPALIACGATVVVRSSDGERELPLLELYRRPTEENRSLVALAVGELVVAVRLPAPPGGVGLSADGRAAGVLVPARLGRGGPRGATSSRSPRPASRTSRARSTRPTRSPGCPATRRARGSGRCWRRSWSGRLRPSALDAWRQRLAPAS